MVCEEKEEADYLTLQNVRRYISEFNFSNKNHKENEYLEVQMKQNTISTTARQT